MQIYALLVLAAEHLLLSARRPPARARETASAGAGRDACRAAARPRAGAGGGGRWPSRGSCATPPVRERLAGGADLLGQHRKIVLLAEQFTVLIGYAGRPGASQRLPVRLASLRAWPWRPCARPCPPACRRLEVAVGARPRCGRAAALEHLRGVTQVLDALSPLVHRAAASVRRSARRQRRRPWR